MVQSLVLKDGKLLLMPDKLALSDGHDCECCEEAPPCGCGALVTLTGAFGFTVDIIYAGGTASYCTASPTAGNVMTPGFTAPGFYDPATYPSGAISQRYAACDTYTRAGEYRIDTVIDTGRTLKLYFASNCTSLPTLTGWEDSGSGVAGVSQIVNIVIGVAC